MEASDWQGSPDRDLVLAAALGDLAAFDELVRRYRPAVVVVARQIAGEAAEDAAQDSLLLAFKALPQLDDPDCFGSWLHAITRHRARRLAQNASRRPEAVRAELDCLILSRLAGPHEDPVRGVLAAEERREIRQVLELLPAELRLALHLRYLESMPVARVAEFLGLPLTTVKWRLHRGRTLMRRALQERRELAPGERRDENVP